MEAEPHDNWRWVGFRQKALPGCPFRESRLLRREGRTARRRSAPDARFGPGTKVAGLNLGAGKDFLKLNFRLFFFLECVNTPMFKKGLELGSSGLKTELKQLNKLLELYANVYQF